MKYNIRQKKGRKTKTGIVGEESKAEFYERLEDLMRENPNEFFMRLRCDLTPGDVEKFQVECLNPILENLCDWYEWQASCHRCKHDRFDAELRRKLYPEHVFCHYRLPFGIYNPTLEGRPDLDGYHEYLTTGNEGYLSRVESLFSELE